MMNISVVVTVLNEESTIKVLLRSLSDQSRPADEIIITDGGSIDRTQHIITDFQHSHPNLPLHLIIKKGNRSVGRNAAIEVARFPFIAITDAGCTPHSDWLMELENCIKTVQTEKRENCVIAGYYDAHPRSSLESAIVPYVLVMPDRVDKMHFLPATRSMLLPKNIWEKLGKFDEKLNDNEDYAFAHKMIDQNVVIKFAENAKVTWLPRRTISEFWTMIFRFARGDAYSGILRPKVGFIFVRYFLAFMILFFGLMVSARFELIFFILASGFYILWAIQKNFRCARAGWYWLPALQVVSDLAVMFGTLSGIIRRALKNSGHDDNKNSTTTR